MKSKDKLVLLADKLDRKGLTAEAALVDRVIAKRSFDEGSRTDIDEVIVTIRQGIDELIRDSQGLDDHLQAIFLDKLNKISESMSQLEGYNDLSVEDEESDPDVGDLGHPGTAAEIEEADPNKEADAAWWNSLS